LLEDYDSEVESGKILLKPKTLIDGDKHAESHFNGSAQQLAVSQTIQASFGSGLNVMTWKVVY
jgi:hypothetical protein